MTETSGCMNHRTGQGKACDKQAGPTPARPPVRPGHFGAGWQDIGPPCPTARPLRGQRRSGDKIACHDRQGCMHTCRRWTPSCFPLNCKARKCPASTNQAILRGPEKIFRVAAAAVDRRLHAEVAGTSGAGRTHRPPVPEDRAEPGSPRAGGHAELSPCRTKANDSDA